MLLLLLSFQGPKEGKSKGGHSPREVGRTTEPAECYLGRLSAIYCWMKPRRVFRANALQFVSHDYCSTENSPPSRPTRMLLTWPDNRLTPTGHPLAMQDGGPVLGRRAQQEACQEAAPGGPSVLVVLSAWCVLVIFLLAFVFGSVVEPR